MGPRPCRPLPASRFPHRCRQEQVTGPWRRTVHSFGREWVSAVQAGSFRSTLIFFLLVRCVSTSFVFFPTLSLPSSVSNCSRSIQKTPLCDLLYLFARDVS